ncbi:MAG TPA: hypothetical protein DCE41_17050 [Cytophagales bacterium]|nr:hypothetical protein [Cytophagales bacterium]HAA20107.1 hypothetical protein [Cytophagales bacterium]HAP64087.1 hypothetical protein [Cytophagales bacterium]
MKKFELAFECPEQLERMEKTPEGFHCGVCQKQVLDFRDKSAEEIQQILNQSLTLPCAVFQRSQFRYPFLKAAAVASFSLTLSIASCAQTNTDKRLVNEGPLPPNVRFDKVADQPTLMEIPITGGLKSIPEKEPFEFPEMRGLDVNGVLVEDEVIMGEPSELVFGVVEMQATPEGGIEALLQALREAIKIPNPRLCVEGRVYIQFVVEPTGETSHHEVVRGLQQDLDEAVLKAFQNLPIRWVPGTQRGEKVRTRMVIPVGINL